ncbi:protein takeout-like [Leptopilina boulardi]|uniref:protein takeout-like n=1 Tax=Leptopilina boulardi TaxID=63433 RepID=UPI0021F66CC9|nr:protein takeout-like [Leptopilina boulardi]
MLKRTFIILYLSILVINLKVQAIGKYKGLEFLEPCSKRDPSFDICLLKSSNELIRQFRKGLPQLGYPEVEPIILDQINIAIGEAPNNYRAQFRNITAKGVSTLRVLELQSNISDSEVLLQVVLDIPKIGAVAKYRSSGTLVFVQAGGAGDYWGEYKGVKAKVFIRAKLFNVHNRQYLKLQQLKMDFSVREIKMEVNNIHEGNSILQSALNLFINSYSQDLLKKMKPDIRRKLVHLMSNFVENLFSQVPYDAWMEN